MKEVEEIYNTIDLLFKSNREQKALLFIVEELLERKYHKDFEFCNEFIKYIHDKDINSDYIVHVLNTLSPIQSKLEFWKEFTEHMKTKLYELVGDRAKTLIKCFIINNDGKPDLLETLGLSLTRK